MSFIKKTLTKLKPGSNNSSANTSTDTIPSKEEGLDGFANGTANEKPASGNGNGKLFGSIAGLTNGNPSSSGTSTPDSRRRSKEVILEEKHRRSMDKERIKAEQMRKSKLARIASENFMREGPPDLTKLYRPYSMNMSKNWNHEHRQLFKELDFESQWPPPPHTSQAILINCRNGRPSHYL
jgi:hypothetical protein